MRNLKDIIPQHIPYQSAVFVVFAVNKQIIHVMSHDVSAKYAMIRNYIDVVGDIIDRNSDDGTFVEGYFVKLDLDKTTTSVGFI